MHQPLQGRRVAILATDGFAQAELEQPRRALVEAGAETEVVSPQGGSIAGWDEGEWGARVDVDVPLRRAKPEDYDGLLLPGGVMNCDLLRTEPAVMEFVRRFFEAGKPVAAIGHGPQLLIEAGMTQGRRLTSCPSLRTDLLNAGADWVDEPVVAGQGLVTSRRPEDLRRFHEKMIEEFAGGLPCGPRRSALTGRR